MRKNEMTTRSKHSLSKRILVATLAMAMALPGTTFAGMNNTFSTKTKVAEEAYLFADANLDGKVNLNDAKTTLKAALGIGAKLSEVASKNADVDYSGKVDLTDAKLILQLALGIKKTDDLIKETPGATEPAESTIPPFNPDDATPPPTATPKTTFTPVSANALSVVTGNKLEVDEEAGEYSNAYIEDYKDNEGMFAFYNNDNSHDVNGMKVVNPLSGRREFAETVEEATSLEAPEGKVNAWTLSGASLEAQENDATDFTAIDPRIYNTCSPEAVEYTIPKWKKGLTVSFWAKVKNPADPVLTFTDNDNYILYVRANGTVRFKAERQNENEYSMVSNSITPLGTIGEWTHYTVTIANDWIGVYVNGQENIFDATLMLRSRIKKFNAGFLTRMNPILPATEELVNANERNKYYLTKIDSSSTLLNVRAPWYWNETEGKYMAHDEFTVFHNARYRGANADGTTIMEFLTKSGTNMFIGGAESTLDKESCIHMFKEGAMFSDVQYFEKELTPEQISSNYTYSALATKPADIEFPGENPNKDVVVTQPAVEVVTGASKVELRNNGLGVNATYDAATGIYTFTEPKANADDEIKGVRMVNPFAAVKATATVAGDDKSYLKETIESALTGQAIFPYKYPADYPDASLAGKYVSKTHPSNLADAAFTGHGGCDNASVNPMYGNFYDKYYGDVYAYGTEMTTKTADLANKTILPLADIEKAYTGEQVHEYQRPEWSNGVTLSFWAKPSVVDDSPIITFLNGSAKNGMLLTVDTMGSVCYASLFEAENNAGDWKSGKRMTAQGEPRNTFSTYGDPSYVKANEWNYYTITIANDWIQVYVNGVEMVYKKVNLNRTEMKYFNNGYLTRYNQVGIYTDTMLKDYMDAHEGADMTGVTKEGTPRNYLYKSNYYLKTTADALLENGYDVKGVNSSADSGSIRANGVYEEPFVNHAGSGLLMDLMTDRSVQLYIGGVDGALKESAQFAFSQMYILDEDLGDENIRQYPVTYDMADVLAGTTTEQLQIFVDKDVVAVSADTEGAVALGINDYEGNPIYVSEACNVVATGGAQPEGAYVLQKSTGVESVTSRRKIYSTDHTLSAGTKVAGMVSYYSELTADEVADAYKAALAEKPVD